MRRAAVMSVVPRMIAGPLTPLPSGSESESGKSATGSCAGACHDACDADAGDNDAEKIAGDSDGSRRASRGDDDAGGNFSATAADTLGRQLAARSRNQTLFLVGCCIPGAHVVLAASETAFDGLPPVAVVVTRESMPAQGNESASTGRAATPPPPFAFPSLPAGSAVLDGERSAQMNDNELVMAYVTPPASPVPPSSLAPMGTPTSSPFSLRPFSGRRRRANDPRGARAVASAARDIDNVDARAQQSNVTPRDVYVAMRNHESSVRREITRVRAEVVIVKSQAASTLRRMHGLSAVADGRHSRTGVNLGRLRDLDRSLRELGSRVPSTVGADAARQDEAEKSLAPAKNIKVRPFNRGLLALSELPTSRCHQRGRAL